MKEIRISARDIIEVDGGGFSGFGSLEEILGSSDNVNTTEAFSNDYNSTSARSYLGLTGTSQLAAVNANGSPTLNGSCGLIEEKPSDQGTLSSEGDDSRPP